MHINLYECINSGINSKYYNYLQRKILNVFLLNTFQPISPKCFKKTKQIQAGNTTVRLYELKYSNLLFAHVSLQCIN